jgi:hypothetical protein
MPRANTPITSRIVQWLLAYEGIDGETTSSDTQAAYRVCDKLRPPLTTLAGTAAFQSLLARALALAKQESPALAGWEVRADGSLEVPNNASTHSGATLIAQLIRLMIAFIGESLTLQLLHDVWRDLPHSEIKLEGIQSEWANRPESR